MVLVVGCLFIVVGFGCGIKCGCYVLMGVEFCVDVEEGVYV